MILFKKIISILVLIFSFYSSKSQEIDSSYLRYPNQFEQLQMARGWNPEEISKTLEKYKRNNINSNQDFAQLLGRYYSSYRNIAILLYFYDNGTLRRILFEPGAVMEEKIIKISKDSLYELTDNLSQALNIQKLTADRSPKHRGVNITNSDTTKKYDLNNIIQKLTSILIPAHFSPAYQHLVIIPCLNIGSIPFHLLRPYNTDDYLIDKCSFTVAPTLLDFVFLRSKRLLNPGKYRVIDGQDSIGFSLENPLFICNPLYPEDTEYYFPDLPGAESEINNALSHANTRCTVLRGKGAIKDSVMKHLNGSDFAYFATHGVSDVKNPMSNSFLVLSGSNPFLTSKEIQDLRLQDKFVAPEMVILSACQTGLGKSMDAGLAGSLARSFILSGSDYIIESLWNVDDKATSYLMSRFMYYVTERYTTYFPSGALRLAILDTKKEYPNPLYWASFSAFGTNL